MIGPRVLAGAAAAAFSAGFSCLAVLQHRAYWTGRFDVGNLVQAVWSTAHGDILTVTNLKGDEISRLGAHFDPAVALLAPLWWIWPDASLLLVVQAVAVASGAVPAFKLARKHLGSERAGCAFALAYLLFPATQWLVVDDFHPVAFATPLLLFAVWFLDEQRLVAFAVVAVLALSTKEHIGLAIAMLGLWFAFHHGRRVAGAVITTAGVAAAVLATALVVPHFAPGGGSPFEGRYAAVGGSPWGMAKTAVTDPLRILGALSDGRDGRYLLALVLPLLCLSALAPLLAAAAAPELALNMLSSTETQTSIHFHYTATIVPALVAAAIFGTARITRPAIRRRAPAALVAAGVLAGFLLGPMPQWRWLPGGSALGARDHIVTHRAPAIARALALVPPNAGVSATNTLGAHLSERKRIYSFPLIRDAEWVVVDEWRPSYLDRAVAPAAFRRALTRLQADARFSQVYARDHVLVFRRR